MKHTAIKVLDEIYGSNREDIEISVMAENVEEGKMTEILKEINVFKEKVERIVATKSVEE